MRYYTWEEYYDKFYDWSAGTQVKSLSYLTSLGDADEAAEIIIELQVEASAATRLLKRAVAAGYRFKAEQLLEFLCICDKALAVEAVRLSGNKLSAADMEELYGFMDVEDVVDICRKNRIELPEVLRDEELEDDEPLEEDEEESERSVDTDDSEKEAPELVPIRHRGGFLSVFLAGLAGISDGIRAAGRKHRGRCNGDCANCPPHYGYRHGRWYYGHNHDYGCELGGSKGDGHL